MLSELLHLPGGASLQTFLPDLRFLSKLRRFLLESIGDAALGIQSTLGITDGGILRAECRLLSAVFAYNDRGLRA